MLFQTFVLAVALSATGLAIDLEESEVPYQCRDVCMDVVKLTRDCDAANYGANDDANELACICNGANARTQIPTCEACLSQYDEDGADNDVNELVRKCGFPYATYNTAMPPSISTTAPGSGPPASALKPTTTPGASAPGYAPAESSGTGTAAAPPAPTAGYGNGTSSTTSGAAAPQPSASGTTSGAPAEQTGNVAAVNAVGAGMLGMGVLGWMVGMM
ncbi:hypothetical protein K458DRAFT_312461 [Lentithecium fluviatile CBS 122367]|uniref:Extracellular membrane protein CFEM domain-containing protein n=1 Tax=Lentithecium fluviatile CBS 122367 TaxID=1168545 RepID=A0A6G1IQG1_9PLEO|nr:hypothetical protein K458DRAFT_312461 [Lentithecium fluviatile CBS 122367]